MNLLNEKRIVLGVTGGVAAYKAAELARFIVKSGATLDVVLTESATKFIGSHTFQAISGKPVWQSLWDERMSNGMAHIDLTRKADALLVAPATADFIAKVSHGFADDLLSTLVLARDCPLLLAPAMNRQMWENPATQRNIELLTQDGIAILGPGDGAQACGETGPGRMLEPEEIFDELMASFQPKVLKGRKVLLTAGPTFEPIDPVRGITNTSSGRMGYCLAQACVEAGAVVTLVSGPCNQSPPRHVEKINVTTALEMRSAVLSRIADHPIFISVAAVADYRPIEISQQKIKKTAGNMEITLTANPDILAEIAALEKPPFCVGFAAESTNMEEYAERKRKSKRIPLIVGNLVQDGLNKPDNVVTLFDDTGRHPLPQSDKLTVARNIVHHLSTLLKD